MTAMTALATVRADPRKVAITGGVLTAFLIGGSVPISGLLVDYPLLSGQAMRYAFGALLLLVWARARRVPLPLPKRGDLPALLAIVAVGMLGFNVCLIHGQNYAEPGLMAAVLGGSPLVIAIVAPLLRGQRPVVRALVGAGVVVGGVVVLSGGGTWHGPGLLFAVLTMLGESAFTLFAIGVVGRLGGFAVSFWCHLLAAGIGAALGTVLDGGAAWPAPRPVEALVLGVVATMAVVAFCVWYHAVSVLGADRAAVMIGLMPVAGLIVAVAIGAQSLTMAAVAGTVLVAAGCALGLRNPEATDRRAPS